MMQFPHSIVIKHITIIDMFFDNFSTLFWLAHFYNYDYKQFYSSISFNIILLLFFQI